MFSAILLNGKLELSPQAWQKLPSLAKTPPQLDWPCRVHVWWLQPKSTFFTTLPKHHAVWRGSKAMVPWMAIKQGALNKSVLCVAYNYVPCLIAIHLLMATIQHSAMQTAHHRESWVVSQSVTAKPSSIYSITFRSMRTCTRWETERLGISISSLRWPSNSDSI